MPATQRATLYVRASIPNRIREHVYGIVDDLERLVESGRLGTVDVETWDTRVPLDGDGVRLHGGAREAYAEFAAWADEVDRSLEPYFQRRETAGGDVLVPPILCLVVENDGDVQAVYPSETAEEKATVLDGVDSLYEPQRATAN